MSRLQAREPRVLRTISLLDKEREIVSAIEFDALALEGPEDAHPNGERVCALWRLLAERDGIPPHRLSYFNDPDFHPGGRGKSRHEIFVRNGCSGEDILRHPHFLDHLRYMIHGAALPDSIIDGFAEAVDDCGMVTSSDYGHLTTRARQLARSNLAKPSEHADEFYNLALDLGFEPAFALYFRKAVMGIR